jgi:hypothetical protein
MVAVEGEEKEKRKEPRCGDCQTVFCTHCLTAGRCKECCKAAGPL